MHQKLFGRAYSHPKAPLLDLRDTGVGPEGKGGVMGRLINKKRNGRGMGRGALCPTRKRSLAQPLIGRLLFILPCIL